MESFDGRTGEWRSEAPMPTKRSGLTSCVYGGRVYVIGGYDGAAPGLSGLGLRV
jgi:hypothetical protein